MTVAVKQMWVNLGCGKFPLDGYINIDAHEKCADIVEDVWTFVPTLFKAVRGEEMPR